MQCLERRPYFHHPPVLITGLWLLFTAHAALRRASFRNCWAKGSEIDGGSGMVYKAPNSEGKRSVRRRGKVAGQAGWRSRCRMDAYAVVETGGKQYRVKQGDTLTVERLSGEAGTSVRLDRVLACSDGTRLIVGRPWIGGAAVEAEIVEHLRGPKLIAYRKKRRKGYERKKGHRQALTRIRVNAIAAG